MEHQRTGALALAGGRVVGAGSLAYGGAGEDFALFSLDVSDGSGADQPAFLTGIKALWAERGVFVWPYGDPRRLALDIAQGLEDDVVLRDALWTSRREDVLRASGRTVVLTVPERDEAETLQWLFEQLPRLRERSAPLHFFVLEDGEAAAQLEGERHDAEVRDSGGTRVLSGSGRH